MLKINRNVIAILTAIALAPAALYAGADDPPSVTDDYVISFGPQWNVIPGDPAFFLPINVSFSQPTARIVLLLSYDPTMVTPTLLAPNVFAQSFTYDLSRTGKIKLTLITDLPPPPDVPPIIGDTTAIWISFRITSRFIGYDYLTTIDYFEDPVTPGIDNFIVLENNIRIAPPNLVLTQGNMLVRLPRYGDINLNSLPWEIGDAITFLNFFMGAPFTRQQYANADCNRDGVQATVSDLVFLLNAISYDTVAAHRPDDIFAGTRLLEGTSPDNNLLLDASGICDIVIESPGDIGAVALTLDLGQDAGLVEVFLYPEAGGMDLAYSVTDGVLRIAVLDWERRSTGFAGGRLLGIRYTGAAPPAIRMADFSDARGALIEAAASLRFADGGDGNLSSTLGLTLSGYPNPFNSEAVIRMSLPAGGRYELSVFDVLGRKVRNLLNEYRVAGSNSVVWDGADDAGAGVSSGIYFVRLRGDTGSSAIQLHLLK